MGRRRNIWNIDSENHIQREAAKRMAINMPIQGTAAEMIKLAMLDIHRTLINDGYNARMILQIHDELLFEAPAQEIDELQDKINSAPTEIIDIANLHTLIFQNQEKGNRGHFKPYSCK